MNIPEFADLAMKRRVRQGQAKVHACLLNDLVPALHTLGAIVGISFTQSHIERRERWLVDQSNDAVDHLGDRIGRAGETMIIIDLVLLERALGACVVETGGARISLGTR